METKIVYPDDLSDEEWDLIKHSVKTTDKRGDVVVLMQPRKSRVAKGIS